jgi:charged multivesicular body protein 2A
MGNTPSKSPEEALREHRRQLRKAQRELDRERNKLKSQETKLIQEIKKLAKQNQTKSVKILAKDLVRTRTQIAKFYEMSSQLKGVEMRIQTMKSTTAMGEALQGATKAMVSMGKSMNLPELNRIMQEFSRENQRMELTSEVMDDAINMAVGAEDEEDEVDQVVSRVLAEIGVELAEDLESGPMRQLPRVQVEETKTTEVDDLQSRLARLR